MSVSGLLGTNFPSPQAVPYTVPYTVPYSSLFIVMVNGSVSLFSLMQKFRQEQLKKATGEAVFHLVYTF